MSGAIKDFEKRSRLYTWQTFTHRNENINILHVFWKLSLFEVWQSNINPQSHKMIICYLMTYLNLKSFGWYLPRYKVSRLFTFFWLNSISQPRPHQDRTYCSLKWNSFHLKEKTCIETTFEKCWWNVIFPHNNFLAFMTKILCYLQLPVNFILGLVATKRTDRRDINISLSCAGAVFQVRPKQWVFGTPHTSIKSNFFLQVSLSSKNALIAILRFQQHL